MNSALPAAVFNRLIVTDVMSNNIRKAYFLESHRPFILYGFNGVSWDFKFESGLRNVPDGRAVSTPPVPGFLTLVEWGTGTPRLDRVPFMASDPRSFVAVGRASFPMFRCAPFLVDFAASYIEVPGFLLPISVAVLDVVCTPADAANIRAAGMRVPSLAAGRSNRLNR